MDPNDLIDQLIQLFADEIAALTRALQEGRITPADWRRGMSGQFARFHAAAWMLGQGYEFLDALDNQTVTDLFLAQLAYLNRFTLQIEAAEEFDAGWLARAESYAGAIRVPYWKGRTKILPLPAMPAQGTQCHNNCRCSWDVVTLDEENGDYDATWIREAGDSCQTCIEREAQWNPIRIRGGNLELTPAQMGQTGKELADIWEESLKHLAGGEHSHDQRTHGFRYGATSLSRARRMKKAGTFEEFKRRARARKAGGGTRPDPKPKPAPRPAGKHLTDPKDGPEARRRLEQLGGIDRVGKAQQEIATLTTRLNVADEKYKVASENFLKSRIENGPDDPRTVALRHELESITDVTRQINNFDMKKAQAAEKEAREALNVEAHKVLELPSEMRGKLDIPDLKKLDMERAQSAKEGVDFVTRMVHKDLIHSKAVTVGKGRGNRSHMVVDTNEVKLTKGADTATMVHELGHWLENPNGGMLGATSAFLKKRGAGERAKHLGDGYGSREISYFDKFINKYMGKLYLRFGSEFYSTEIMSMGLEMFFEDPLKLARLDPEYFDFIFAIIRGGGMD